MTDQEQSVSNGIAIQSAGDTNINTGLTTTEMRQIIEAISAQLPAYAAMANEIVKSRLEVFEEKILTQFAQQAASQTNAFKDPDFQYLLGRAQTAFARSGDEQVCDTLVSLISKRSLETGRTRLALSLNQAVEIASVLTSDEFAELSLIYMLKYTRNHTVNNLSTLIGYINSQIKPLLSDVSEEHSSYTYLEAQGCGSISLGETALRDIFVAHYGGALGSGVERHMLMGQLPETKKDLIDSPLFIACLNDPSKMQPNAMSRSVFQENFATYLSEVEADTIWNVFEATIWSEAEICDRLRSHVADIDKLFRIWKTSPIKSMTLTSVGIAIAHANVVRLLRFDADLSNWIK